MRIAWLLSLAMNSARPASPFALRDQIFAGPVDAVDAELRNRNNRLVLDAGCGTATLGVTLAQAGSSVVGIDIDRVALGEAKEMAESLGVSDRLFLVEASSEAMPFRPDVVDCVMSKSTMQYVDHARALSECRRVLKGGATLVLIENLPNNPFVSLIRVGRKLVSRIAGDTSYVDSISGYVTVGDLMTLGSSFESSQRRAFHVTRVASLLLLARNPGSGLLRAVDSRLATLDRVLLERFPPIGRLAWIVTFVGHKLKPEPLDGNTQRGSTQAESTRHGSKR